MSAFDEWAKIAKLDVHSKITAKEIFNAGMTRAAEICEGEIFADIEAYDDACKDCKHAIIKARDGV